MRRNTHTHRFKRLSALRSRIRPRLSALPLRKLLLALVIAGGLIASLGTFAKTTGGNVDIVLAIDTSASISSAEYRDQINAAAAAIRAIPITSLPGNLRIAVIEFAGGATTQIPMTTVNSKADLKRIAAQLAKPNKWYGDTDALILGSGSGPSHSPSNVFGGTNAGAGLTVADKLFGSSSNNKSICIVSDGEFTDQAAFNKAVKNLKKDQLKRLGIASFSYNKGGFGGGTGGIKVTTEADLQKSVFGDGKAAVAKSAGAFAGAITSACLNNLQNIFPAATEEEPGKDKPRKPLKPYVPKTEKPAAPCSGAKDPVTGKAPDCTSVVEYIDSAYGWLAILGGLLAVLMLIYAGYSYMGSNGDPEKMSNAKDVVEKALIGLALLILATLILNAVNGRTTKSCKPGQEGCGQVDFSVPDGGSRAPK